MENICQNGGVEGTAGMALGRPLLLLARRRRTKFMQKCREGWKLVTYASRSLCETEKRYAQIEKEALAITWDCKKFATLPPGKKV